MVNEGVEKTELDFTTEKQREQRRGSRGDYLIQSQGEKGCSMMHRLVWIFVIHQFKSSFGPIQSNFRIDELPAWTPTHPNILGRCDFILRSGVIVQIVLQYLQ